MKRLISIILAALFLMGLTGCQMSEAISVMHTNEERSEQPESEMLPSQSESLLTTGEMSQTEDETSTDENKSSSTQGEISRPDSETSTDENKSPAPEDDRSQTEDETSTTENTLPAENLPLPDDDDLVRVVDYIPQIRQELAYATVNNFSGQRIYDFTDAYLRYGTVKKLAKVCDELAAQGLGLKIWDGFRPVTAQEILWEICPDETFVSHPVTGNRSHCRGSAVDITLVALDTGEELPVPTGFDNFTAYADRDYSDCSPEAAANASVLEATMEKHGFKPYSAEWWHFTDTDDYPVDEYFDPAVPVLWAANCKQYIGMRKSVGSSGSIKGIRAGEVVQLIGWSGKFAKVSHKGTVGYVMSSYIMPEDDNYLTNCLDTVTPTDTYSYEQMLEDICVLQCNYSDIVTTEMIGTSELGREIPVIRIGDTNAKYHVLFQGAIHGREHMTAWLLMALADYWLNHDILSYGDVCYHIIPMSNPDGVEISQSLTLTEAQWKIYQNDVRSGLTTRNRTDYASLWKANGLGIDINRNFPAGWQSLDGRTAPSSQNYEGDAPFSTAEACVLRDYTLRYAFDATISYHATGSIIFYEYGRKQPVNDLSKSLGKAVKEITGYDMEGCDSTDGAGYKDWVMEELNIPSVTIEIGCQNAPLADREIYSVFVRNYRVLPAVARWLQQ